MENRTRYQERVDLAEAAVMRAAGLARQADQAAMSSTRQHEAQPLATVATAWAHIGLANAAIAQALADDTALEA
ncbi:hypothetical protein [Streptomyces sp. YIM S03343]